MIVIWAAAAVAVTAGVFTVRDLNSRERMEKYRDLRADRQVERERREAH